jgi:lipopolysaccharide export system permease protein
VRILSRYFLASYLSLFGIILLASLLLVIVIEMLVNFDEIVDHHEAAGSALAYLLVRIPSIYLRDLIPATSFAAAFLCLGIPARRHEIVAIKTSGIPPLRVALPVLAAAAVLSALTLLLNETILLEANREFIRIQNPGQPVVFGRGSFWYHKGDTFYNVAEVDRESRTLRQLKLFETNDRGRLVRSIRADEAEIGDDGRWGLENATFRHFDPQAPAVPSAPRHQEHAVIDVGEGAHLDLLDTGMANLSLLQLLDAIDLRRQEGFDAPRYRSMLHARLAAPLSVWIFALLAVSLGIGVDRTRSIGVSALGGIGAVALYFVVWQVGALFGESGFPWAAPAPWLVVAAATAAGAWLFRRAPR